MSALVEALVEVRATAAGLRAPLVRDLTVESATARILDAIAREGTAAVLRFTQQFDEVRLEPRELRLSRAVLASAHAQAEAGWLEALRAQVELGARSVAELPLEHQGLHAEAGRTVRTRWIPRERAGFYLRSGPRFDAFALAREVGRVRAVGIRQRIAVTPPSVRPTLPGAFGVNLEVLAAAAELELDALHVAGGAQGLAWLEAQVGPEGVLLCEGGRYATEARRQLGRGPAASERELLILLDASADPAPLAAILPRLHGRIVVLGLDRPALEKLAALAPSTQARLLLANRDQALVFAQAWAPAQVALLVADPSRWLGGLTFAERIGVGALDEALVVDRPVRLTELARLQTVIAHGPV